MQVAADTFSVVMTPFGYALILSLLLKSSLVAADVYLFILFANDTTNVAEIVGAILLFVCCFLCPVGCLPIALVRLWSARTGGQWPPINSGENYFLNRKYNIKVYPKPVARVKTEASSPSRSRLGAYLHQLDTMLVYDPMRPRKPQADAPQAQEPMCEPTGEGDHTHTP